MTTCKWVRPAFLAMAVFVGLSPGFLSPKDAWSAPSQATATAQSARAGMSMPRFTEVARSADVWRTFLGWGISWADIDGDGDMDLLQPSHDVGDPLLSLNNGDGTFRDVSDRIPTRPYADHHVWRWADINNDGFPDLSNGVGSTGGHTFNFCEVFLNDGKGFFRDVTDSLGLGGTKKRGRSITWCDVDNDGRLDALITSHLPQKQQPKYEGFRGFQLFLNREGLKFEDVSDASGVHHDGHSYWCAPADFDGDGDMDLIVEHLKEPGRVYENLGGAKFREITKQFPFAEFEDISDVEWVDYDEDGDLDLYLSRGAAGRNATSEGYRNEGNQVEFFFERAGRSDDNDEIAIRSKATHFELRVCEEFKETIFNRHMFRPTSGEFSIGRKGVPAKSLPLYLKWHAPGRTPENEVGDDDVPSIDDSPRDLGRPDVLPTSGPLVCVWREDKEPVWHVRFIRGEDRGNQHFSARVILNASVEAVTPVDCEFTPYQNYLYENQNGKFIDVTQRTGLSDSENTGDAIWQDFDNDGDKDLLLVRQSFSVNGAAPLALYVNQGNGHFVCKEKVPGLERQVIQSRAGVTCADYDNNGYLDIAVGAGISNPPVRYGESTLYRNEGGDNHWLKIRLRGVKCNADAIGAWVFLEAGGKRQTRYHLAGQSFEGQDTSVIHFGLGNAGKADSVMVKWPDGKMQTLHNVSANQEIAIRQE